MILLLSSATGFLYKHAFKPLLFRRHPDAVHTSMVKTGHRLQVWSLLRWLTRVSLRYDNQAVLSQTIHDITFLNPVGLSAGLDKNFEIAPLMNAVGFGFMEGGSVTLESYSGNPRPWFHRLPVSESLVVNVGLANHGVVAAIANIKQYSKKSLRDFPLNVSVAKTNSPSTREDEPAIADYVGSLRLLQKAGIGDMYTLNISCPNAYGGEPFTSPERLRRLLAATDQLKLQKPLFIKMPINLPWDEFKKLTDIANKHAVAGLTIGNLAKDRRAVKDELPDSVKGNLSGKPTQQLSDALIKRTRRFYQDRFIIIGVGGIFTAEDAYTKIKNGADLVELITGVVFNGPQLIGQINRDLVRLLHQDGFNHVSEAVGSATLPPSLP